MDQIVMAIESAVRHEIRAFSSAVERWRRYFDESDVSQQMRMRCWEYIARNGQNPPSPALLRKIARSAGIDLIRRAQRWALMEVPAGEPGEGEEGLE